MTPQHFAESFDMQLNHLDINIHASIMAGLDSAQLLIVKQKQIIHHKAYGNANLDTLYDIASLTKIFSMTHLCQYYYDHNGLNLNGSLKEIFPEYFLNQSSDPKSNITIKMLLAHEAGFEPNPLFYDENYSPELYCQNRDEFISKLLKAPLIHPPQSKSLYSDVDFMLLTMILEKIFNQSLDEQLWHAFPSLKNDRITYCPLKNGYHPSQIAPTELHGNTRDHSVYFHNVRTQTIWGEVQDEKAYHCMNGVSGHAGLFANGEALYHALQLIEPNATFLQSQSDDPSFGLGWRLNLGGDMRYHFGDYASSKAYGHTGWTGCCVVIDPTYDLTIIYLTNRKHSKVLNPKINPHRFLGDILWAGQYKNIMNEIYTALGLAQ